MSRNQGDSLTPIVFRDFTAGLYELGHDRGIPQNALLECQDCYPLPGGGVRAAFAWREEALGGVPRNRRVIGFHAHRGGINRRELASLEMALMLATTSTNSTGPFTYEFWGLTQSSVAGTSGSTWSQGPSHSSMRHLFPTRFVTFRAETNGVRWYYNVAASDTAARTQRGVFSIGVQLNTTISTQVYNENVIFLTPHQERLIYIRQAITGTTAGLLDRYDRLAFTAPATFAAPPSSNVLDVGIYKDGTLSWLDSIYPQDLLILKQPQAGFMIQGDLGAGPIVREMFVDNLPERLTWGIRTPSGVAYLTETQGVWLWSGGQDHAHISPQIVGSPMTEVVLYPPGFANIGATGNFNLGFLGTVGFGKKWLFTPKGYVYDLTLGSWFRTTLPGSGVYSQWVFDPMRNDMYAAGHREPGDDVRIISASLDERTLIRSNAFSATLPLIDMAERNVQVRYIEVFGQGFGNGGTWQLELTNAKGQTATTPQVAVPARAFSARFDTQLQGDWLKIRLLSEGNPDASQAVTQASEAPMLDRIVVWARPKTRRT